VLVEPRATRVFFLDTVQQLSAERMQLWEGAPHFVLKLRGERDPVHPDSLLVADANHSHKSIALDHATQDIWWLGSPSLPEPKVPVRTRQHMELWRRAQQLLPGADRLIIDGETIPIGLIQSVKSARRALQLQLIQGGVRHLGPPDINDELGELENPRGQHLSLSDLRSLSVQ
jgi:hypothetical protein